MNSPRPFPIDHRLESMTKPHLGASKQEAQNYVRRGASSSHREPGRTDSYMENRGPESWGCFFCRHQASTSGLGKKAGSTKERVGAQLGKWLRGWMRGGKVASWSRRLRVVGNQSWLYHSVQMSPTGQAFNKATAAGQVYHTTACPFSLRPTRLGASNDASQHGLTAFQMQSAAHSSTRG